MRTLSLYCARHFFLWFPVASLASRLVWFLRFPTRERTDRHRSSAESVKEVLRGWAPAGKAFAEHHTTPWLWARAVRLRIGLPYAVLRSSGINTSARALRASSKPSREMFQAEECTECFRSQIAARKPCPRFGFCTREACFHSVKLEHVRCGQAFRGFFALVFHPGDAVPL